MRDDPGLSRILLAVEFSRSCHNVVDFACAFARALDAEVDVLHVDAFHPPGSEEGESEYTSHDYDSDIVSSPRRIREGLQAVGDRLTEAGIPNTTRCVHSLAVAPTILAEARAAGADFIMVGTHGSEGVRRFLLGSVSDELLLSADRGLMLVSEDEPAPAAGWKFNRILVPVDIPADAMQIGLAASIARRSSATLHLLHVAEQMPLPSILSSSGPLSRFFSPEQSRLEEEMRRIQEQLEGDGILVQSTTAEGNAARVTVAVAEEIGASFVILPPHGATAVERLMHTITTERVARMAGWPVMIAPNVESEER